jgi:hypothetical protein
MIGRDWGKRQIDPSRTATTIPLHRSSCQAANEEAANEESCFSCLPQPLSGLHCSQRPTCANSRNPAFTQIPWHVPKTSASPTLEVIDPEVLKLVLGQSLRGRWNYGWWPFDPTLKTCKFFPPEDGGKIRAAFATQPLSLVSLRQSSLREERSHSPSCLNRREERKCTGRFRDC